MDRIICPFEVKLDADGDDDGTIGGYGSTFGNVDSYGDTVAKGAFKKTIADAKYGNGPWPAMLSQHGSEDQTPIGIWTGMDEDDNGLNLKGKLALNTTRGADTYNLLKMKPRPALNGLSIGYRAKDFELHKSGSGPNGARRTLRSVDLVECSLVTFPADKFARVASVKAELNTIREFETFLRDAGGFSIAQAKAIAATGYKAMVEEEEEVDGGDLKQLLEMFQQATNETDRERLIEVFQKSNPNHDSHGLFSSGPGGGAVHANIAKYLAATKGPKKPTETEINITAARIAEVIANSKHSPNGNNHVTMTNFALGAGPGRRKPGHATPTRQELEKNITSLESLIRDHGAAPIFVRELTDAHAALLTLKK